MKKLACCWVVVFLLLSGFTKAQMGFKPSEFSINSPQETNVYKKYTEGKTFLGITLGAAMPFGSYDYYNSNINSVGTIYLDFFYEKKTIQKYHPTINSVGTIDIFSKLIF